MLGLTREPLVSLVVLVLIGLAAGPIDPMIATIIQQRTPADFRGRASGAPPP